MDSKEPKDKECVIINPIMSLTMARKYDGQRLFGQEDLEALKLSTSCEMAGDLLKELPSFNKQNFSKFNVDSAVKCSHQRPVVYLPTKDIKDQAVIVTDKANILLRYLHQQWETKNQHRKRDPTSAELPNSGDYKPSAKVPRKTGPAEDNT